MLAQDPHSRHGLLAAIELASRRRRELLGSIPVIERRPDGQRGFRLAGQLREIDQHLAELFDLVEDLG